MTVLSTARLELQPFDDQHYDGLRALKRKRWPASPSIR
jgi:hypothetical protein